MGIGWANEQKTDGWRRLLANLLGKEQLKKSLERQLVENVWSKKTIRISKSFNNFALSNSFLEILRSACV